MQVRKGSHHGDGTLCQVSKCLKAHLRESLLHTEDPPLYLQEDRRPLFRRQSHWNCQTQWLLYTGCRAGRILSTRIWLYYLSLHPPKKYEQLLPQNRRCNDLEHKNAPKRECIHCSWSILYKFCLLTRL